MKDVLKLNFDPLFYIKDLEDGRVLYVETESEHGYHGYIVDCEKKEYSPFYIAKTFIDINPERYDFSKSVQTLITEKGETNEQ